MHLGFQTTLLLCFILNRLTLLIKINVLTVFLCAAFTREEGHESADDEPWNHKEAKNRLVPGSMPNFEEALFVSNQVKTALSAKLTIE